MPQLIKFALGLIAFVVVIWALFYFTIFLFFIAIILVCIYYIWKFFNLFSDRFENIFNWKYNFHWRKKSDNWKENSSHVKEKFFIDLDKKYDEEEISDAEIKK